MSEPRKACNVQKRDAKIGNADVSVSVSEVKKKKLSFYLGIASIFVVPVAIFMFVFYSPIGVSLVQTDFTSALTFSLVGLFIGIGLVLVLGVIIIVKKRNNNS